MTTSHSARRPSTRRRATVLAAIATTAVLLTSCLSTDQSTDVDLVNQARKTARLSTLSIDYGASDKAQGWSQHMAKTGVLEHTGGGTRLDTSGLTNWCSVGENVGYGSSVKQVHDAFMKSAAHKAHIVGKFTRIGTGVYKSGSRYWVTEIFLRAC